MAGEADNAVRLESLKLLVVDDDPGARALLSKVLRNCGYQHITTAASGAEALDQLSKPDSEFHLVVCDVMMPNMNGLELLPHIRQSGKAFSDIPVIMISGTEDIQTVQDCLLAGADDYMLKPPSVSKVKNIWANVWKKKKDQAVSRELKKERARNSTMDLELRQLRERIARHSSDSDKIDTPLAVIRRTVREMQDSTDVDDRSKMALSAVLSVLWSSDMYRPAISKGVDVNGMLERWLKMELGTEDTPDSDVVWGDLIAHSSESNAQSNDEEGRLEILRAMRSATMNPWTVEPDQLLRMVYLMFDDFDLYSRLNVSREKMKKLLVEVRANYCASNPYHNFIHAFDVTRNIYVYLSTCGAAAFLGHLEIFAVLLSGLLHDVGHPALNNNFVIRTRHPLAMRYNDKSVLENYHCAFGFSLMQRPECNVLENLDEDQYSTVRTAIINNILATDLVRHAEIVDRFKGAVHQPFDREDKGHRSLLTQILIKTADIANPAYSFEIARAWAERVQDEFFMQGDQERQLDMPITAFMDRQDANLQKMQTGFLGFFVIPLLGLVAKLLPEMQVFLDQASENVATWKSLSPEELAAGRKSEE